MAQGLEAAPGLPVRHRVQRHELAAGQADVQLLQGVQTGALGARQQHPHLQLVLTDLHQLGQMAVEGGAQLPAQQLRGDAQGLAGGRDAVDQLLAPEGHVVDHVRHAGDAFEPLGQVQRGGLERPGRRRR